MLAFLKGGQYNETWNIKKEDALTRLGLYYIDICKEKSKTEQELLKMLSIIKTEYEIIKKEIN